MMSFSHWKVDIDQDHIAWWWLDRKNASVNSLNVEIFQELDTLLDEVKINSKLRGIIIISSKSSGFIAGADITQFTQIPSEEEALRLTLQGQQVFNKLASLTLPTVAVISGFCMGGGSELALACRYRIAEDSPKTRIGFPEVKLGLQPGWGGTIRLPLLMGVFNAMQMILTGNPVDAKTAAKLGVVDIAVPERHLATAAKSFILDKHAPHTLSFIEKIQHWPLLRPFIAKMLRKKLSHKIRREHYPAPYTIVDLWEKLGCTSPQSMENEAKSLAHLIVSPTAQNLIRVFFLQDKLKNLAKNIVFKATHVHVIGAGTMGRDIAAVCALRGLKVTLQDQKREFIAPAIKHIYEVCQSKLKEPRLIQETIDRVIPDSEGKGIVKADVIIEAIIEDLSAKQKLFQWIEENAKPNAILATNTSSILLEEIGQKMKYIERLVGIHFFNPAPKMPLVEVVHHSKISENTQQCALAFVKQLDKLPLLVKSAPGFLVNRILMQYLGESLQLLKEGLTPETIDAAMLDFGMPIGPIALMDTIGLDICYSVAKQLSRDNPGFSLIEEKIREKKLGRKSGEGFYRYKKGKPQMNKTISSTPTPIANRLVECMVKEAKICLAEKIVENSDLLDAGMIFGTGFAPFRGGLLHYYHKNLISEPRLLGSI